MENVKLSDFNPKMAPVETSESYSEYRAIVEVDKVALPVLVRKRAGGSDGLVVLYNGAIQRSKAPDGVVFQRSSWLDDINADVVQIADPTLVKHQRLQIGWGQYSTENWALDSYKALLDHVRSEFKLAEVVHTVHYGSSAGGFQAGVVATLDRGSLAVVNNPQLDWSRYNLVFVKALLRDVFEGAEVEKILEESPWRVNLIEFFKKQNYIPPIEILTNLASDGDYEQQLLPFLEGLRQLHSGNQTPRVNFRSYADANLGHNPLSKPYTLRLINESIERVLK